MNMLIFEKAVLSKLKSISRDVYYFGYKKIVDDSTVKIYESSKVGNSILSTVEQTAFVSSRRFTGKTTYYLYPDIYVRSYRKKVIFDENHFPDLIPNSTIMQSVLLPYLREIRKGVFIKDVRLVIVTDKCQVYHNKPDRAKDCNGISKYNDDIRFEESVVWDLPERKYPSMCEKCDRTERFYPFFPNDVYEYHPILNSNSNYKDVYGNGGFGKELVVSENGIETIFPRFYFPKRNILSNSFFHFGGVETDYKMNIVGTYRPNNDGNGVRTVLFATDDGGRSWFCKYEFGDMGEYSFSQGDKDWRTSFGNTIHIDSSKTADLLNEDKLTLKKRINIVPNGFDKEPKDKFIWCESVNIEKIEWNQTLTITTKDKHGLETGNIVALTGCSKSLLLNALLNNDISSMCGGNGILYKVKVINDYSCELYEYVASAENPISCRHIHQVNRVKDGWIVGTGEIYPNGWLLYVQMKETDTFSRFKAYYPFDIYRLNSSEESIQRTLGAVVLDDIDSSLIFASDHDTLSRKEVVLPKGRNDHISRSSTGIFKGKLEDIDDRNMFELIYEAKEPSYLFKIINGVYVFAGQRGEFAVSMDKGINWKTYYLNDGLQFYKGTNINYSAVGNYIIVFK